MIEFIISMFVGMLIVPTAILWVISTIEDEVTKDDKDE